MLKPNFLLTHKIPLTIYRREEGRYQDGEWVEGGIVQIPIMGNIQPLKPHELMIFSESDRSRVWWKLYTAEQLRSMKEGQDGWASDEFDWKGDRYKVMKLDDWQDGMSILEHCKAYCTRIELTPN